MKRIVVDSLFYAQSNWSRLKLHLIIEDRWRITSLRFDQGMSATLIAAIINCAVQTVYSILKLFCETNDVTERGGRDCMLMSIEK